MSLIHTQPITGPAAWRGPDFLTDDAWRHTLGADDIAGLDAALVQLEARGLRSLTLAEATFRSARWPHACHGSPRNWRTAVVSCCCAACRSSATARPN